MALEYGVIVGRYRSTIASPPDDDDDIPNLEPLVGTIILDPRPEVILVDDTAAEGAMTITPMPTRVQLNAEGDLTHNGKPYVKLLSPESSSIDTHDWTYEVSFDLRTLDGQPVRMNSYDIFVKASNTVERPLDLTKATPVIRNTGTQTIIGPSNVLSIGKVVSGPEAQAIITGTSPEQTLDLVLPRGETGLTPHIQIGTVETTANPADAEWIAQIIRTGGVPVNTALRDMLPSTMKGDKGDTGGWGMGVTIEPGTNLDTIKTPGHYTNSTSATIAQGYPIEGIAGFLNVYMIVKQGHLIYQEWTPNPHTRSVAEWARGSYRRMLNSATWSPWRFTPTQSITAGTDGHKTISTYDPVSNTEIPIAGPGGITYGTVLSITADLNTILTPGIYHQPNSNSPVTAGLNYPPMVSASGSVRGILTVVSWNGANNTAIQEYTTVGTGMNAVNDAQRPGVSYRRTYYNGMWSAWSAVVAQRVDNTAGRAIYTWDDTANREQLIYGDTGWRNISNEPVLLGDFTATSVQLRRVGNSVTLNFDAMKSATVSGNAGFIALPVGFRPDLTNGSGNQRYNTATELTGLNPTVISPEPSYGSSVNPNLRFLHYVATRTLHGSVTFYTRDPWPTSLPGTAIGAIPPSS